MLLARLTFFISFYLLVLLHVVKSQVSTVISNDATKSAVSSHVAGVDTVTQALRTNASMNDLTVLLSALEKGISFGYAHFNDGELRATYCSRASETVDHGWQRCSPKLKGAMIQALTNTSQRFFFGVPCLCEFPHAYWEALELLGLTATNVVRAHPRSRHIACPVAAPILAPSSPSPSSNQSTFTPISNSTLASRIARMTVATLFINGNYQKALADLTGILAKVQNRRGIHLVLGDAVKNYTNLLPFRVKSAYFTPKQHAFDTSYDTMITSEFLNSTGYRSGDIVILTCGPLGRILAAEWSWLRPDITFLELGSFFDPILGADMVNWGRRYILFHPGRNCMFQGDIGAGELSAAVAKNSSSSSSSVLRR